jgi:hypothetical protein
VACHDKLKFEEHKQTLNGEKRMKERKKERKGKKRFSSRGFEENIYF